MKQIISGVQDRQTKTEHSTGNGSQKCSMVRNMENFEPLLKIYLKLDYLENILLKTNLNNQWVDINTATCYTGLSLSTLNRAIRKGILKVSKSNGKRMFRKEWLDTYMEGK